LGISYFCVDVYRNRYRLSERTVPETDLTCYEVGVLDGADFRAAEQTISHAGHAIGEASGECISGGVGHCVETITHVIAHH
jgi:hypothetical protein